MKTIRFILLVDPPLVRKGISSVLGGIPGVSVMKELNTAASFKQYIQDHPSDFILISDSFFDEVTETYIAHPLLLEKTIILDSGYSRKEQQKAKETISVNEPLEHISRKIQDLVSPLRSPGNPSVATDLSEREKTIVKYVAQGLTNKEIAEKLFLSTHTVVTHRKNISNKLGIKSASGLTIYAIVNNIISIDEIENVSGMKE